jgi:hypothetical protein
MNEVEAYIRQAAQARGIDPEIAIRALRGETNFSDPYMRSRAPRPKSQKAEYGDTENSYGPMQLYISGTGAGLGDRALAAGVDPRKNWKGGIDFGLDEVARVGWDQWYGAKAKGVTGMMGVGKGNPIGKYAQVTDTSNPITDYSISPAEADKATADLRADTSNPISGYGGGPAGASPPAAAPAAPAKDERTWLAKLMSGFGKGSGVAASAYGTAKMPAINPTPTTTRVTPGQAAPTLNPNTVNMQRQMMAQALARLNTGKLFLG